MSWRDVIEPVRMERIAVVAPTEQLQAVLLAVAAAGVVEPVCLPGHTGPTEIEAVTASSIRHLHVSALAAWTPASELPALANALSKLGGSVVRRPTPRGMQPPTLLTKGRASGAFQPLVDTYSTVPYADMNPSIFAGVAYVLMFGMMFGDVGHGACLFLGGLLLYGGRPRVHARFRKAAPFVTGAGLTSAFFGLAYGEAFGPTGLVPTLWLAPLSQPLTLMGAAIAVGAAFLSVSYALGTINRWREGGFTRALVALSGLAGIALYVGLALLGGGLYLRLAVAVTIGACLATGGLLLAFVGLFAATEGGFSGVLEAGVELFDGIMRLATNTISFARLAAFGMTHAALSAIVWSATAALWNRGPAWWALAAVVFAVGNVVTFALEALVAAIQALRLEYYEMFSRIFVSPGRAFAPWHIAPVSGKAST